jgi:hypothetical protein
MAALKHPYKDPNANISTAPNNTVKTNINPISTISHNLAATTLSTLSHTIAATTPKTLLNHPQSKTTDNPESKAKTPANIKGAKRSPKTHDKANGKQQEWIGESGGGLLGVWAFFEGG